MRSETELAEVKYRTNPAFRMGFYIFEKRPMNFKKKYCFSKKLYKILKINYLH